MSTSLTPATDPTPAPTHPRDVVYTCPCGNLLPVPSIVTLDAAAHVLCTLHEPPVPMRRYYLTET